MTKAKGFELIDRLYNNPSKFFDSGTSYQLLQEYFNGFPIDTLIPLLAHNDPLVKRVATFILSELGLGGYTLIDYVIPLLHDEDRYIKYHALEIVMVCSEGRNIDKFSFVVPFMEDNDDVIRILTMKLVSNADNMQLESGICFYGEGDTKNKLHREGLSALLKIEQLNPEQVASMINSDERLTRKYGIIAAKKLYTKYPNLIIEALSNEDPDISNFSRRVIEILSHL
jgi:hypothetical protein